MQRMGSGTLLLILRGTPSDLKSAPCPSCTKIQFSCGILPLFIHGGGWEYFQHSPLITNVAINNSQKMSEISETFLSQWLCEDISKLFL